ncbi:MAG: hypothetical protein KOO60_03885 [Gemmatimonadales bacterium]|nr:hypothetical protein [Gemmatimonadales bacterium]
MHQSWLEAANNGNGTEKDIWAVDFTAHPLLDPDFPRKPSRLLQLSRLNFRRMIKDDKSYRFELARIFHPVGSPRGDRASLKELRHSAAECLREADVYLSSTIDLLPPASRSVVLPQAEITDCCDVRELMVLSFRGASELIRYEARRKLFLAQTLLHIDQSRLIQDGPRHKTLFEDLLNEGLWRNTKQIHDLSVGYHISPNKRDISYTSRPEETDTHLDFRSTFLEVDYHGRTIGLDILYYNCRFKRAVTLITNETVDGIQRVTEKARWEDMRAESSGSILSKMIRKGITNPDEIGDLIGAMFIVHDNDALNDLLILLDSCLGAPFRWRNVTDTLTTGKASGSALNHFSSKEFKVLKGDVDILVEEHGGGRPYLFPVEVQIFTLEGYLRTVCVAHEASHLALKLRQFLFGLVPRIFPRGIYGEDWLGLDTESGHGK